MSKAWSGGSDTRWRRFRAQLMTKWRRHGRTQCEIRGPKCTVEMTQVDHIAPLSRGGAKYDEANCRPSCEPCNAGRRDPTPAYDEPPPKRVSTW